MCDAPIGTISWSPAVKWNGSKQLTYRGAEGASSHLSHLVFFDFYSVVHRDSKDFRLAFSLVLLVITTSSFLTGIRRYICISKYEGILCVSFSRTDYGLYIYHLIVRPNFNFLHNSQGIIFPTQSCPVLYSFCASLRHSIIIILLIWKFFIPTLADGYPLVSE